MRVITVIYLAVAGIFILRMHAGVVIIAETVTIAVGMLMPDCIEVCVLGDGDFTLRLIRSSSIRCRRPPLEDIALTLRHIRRNGERMRCARIRRLDFLRIRHIRHIVRCFSCGGVLVVNQGKFVLAGLATSDIEFYWHISIVIVPRTISTIEPHYLRSIRLVFR